MRDALLAPTAAPALPPSPYGVRSHPDHGEDSPLYRSMGFIPKTKKPLFDSLLEENKIKTATWKLKPPDRKGRWLFV